MEKAYQLQTLHNLCELFSASMTHGKLFYVPVQLNRMI